MQFTVSGLDMVYFENDHDTDTNEYLIERATMSRVARWLSENRYDGIAEDNILSKLSELPGKIMEFKEQAREDHNDKLLIGEDFVWSFQGQNMPTIRSEEKDPEEGLLREIDGDGEQLEQAEQPVQAEPLVQPAQGDDNLILGSVWESETQSLSPNVCDEF